MGLKMNFIYLKLNLKVLIWIDAIERQSYFICFIHRKCLHLHPIKDQSVSHRLNSFRVWMCWISACSWEGCCARTEPPVCALGLGESHSNTCCSSESSVHVRVPRTLCPLSSLCLFNSGVTFINRIAHKWCAGAYAQKKRKKCTRWNVTTTHLHT